MKKLMALLLGLIPLAAIADPIVDPTSAISIVNAAMAPAAGLLKSHALTWLGGFVLVQFVLTNWSLFKSGADIEAIIGKLIGSLSWIGLCLFVLSEGPNFIKGVGEMFFGLFGGGLPDPVAIMASTTAISSILAALAVSVGLVDGTAGQLILYILLFIFGTGMFFAIKIFMVQLELGLVVMLSPLSFSLLGLNALKDQGIAPLKSLISLAYRIILMGVILTAFTEVSDVITGLLKGISAVDMVTNGVDTALSIVLGGLGAYALLGYLLYKSDSIAASLAGGGTSMGTADVATSVASGVAAGMAVGASSAAISNAASKTGGSMGDALKVMRNEMGVSNAGGYGSGPSGRNSETSVMNSLAGDSPQSSPKEPVMSEKDLRSMAQDKGVSAVSTTPASASKINASTPSQTSKSGDANSSGIESGNGNDLGKQLGSLVDQLQKQGQSAPNARDRLSALNDHLSKEQAATHVSINTHHND